MKILHTSDWHLGVSINGASCEAEQSRFLDWLIHTIKERQIDVLLIAGDIFHHRQPANSAQRLYFDFLDRAANQTDLRQIVAVAGNHDSPSGLQAPALILKRLNINVVGTITADESTWDSLLIPVFDDQNQPALIVAALPYIVETRLGISGVGRSPEDIQADYHARYANLYSTLASRAQEIYGDLPLIATGHLTTYASREDARDGDFATTLHPIGGVEYLDPKIFDRRFSYIALGHIHRQMPVEKGRVHYCGTPIPTTQKELSKRFVIELTFNNSPEPELEFLEVPRWRDILVLKGSADEVCDDFATLQTDKDLAPYVFIHISDQQHNYQNPPATRLKDITESLPEPKPRIVDFREFIIGDAEFSKDPPPDLDQLSPQDVFSRIYARAHGDQAPPEDILNSFLELLSPEADEDLLHDAELASAPSTSDAPQEVP